MIAKLYKHLVMLSQNKYNNTPVQKNEVGEAPLVTHW